MYVLAHDLLLANLLNSFDLPKSRFRQLLSLFHDTITAISTAEARAALAIVRISGSDAIAILSKVIRDPESLWVSRSGESIYTEIGSIDDVVIHVFRAPRSYTGDDLCEITAHGSPVIARQILDLLVKSGAREAEPGEFSRRAFFNGKIGLEEAELIAIKAEADSDQYLRGSELALHEKFERLRNAYEALISLVAAVDAEIDFGDSDHIQIVDFDDRKQTVIANLEKLIQDSTTRRENAGYFTLALTGPPNVGKSSIFNALLNYERSIVSETPGTTRDYVEAFINVEGFRVKLLDTAGLREAEESIEARGISMGEAAAKHADISLRVTDPSDRRPSLMDGSIYLHNKIDLDNWNEGLSVSALTGVGLRALHEWIAREMRSRSGQLNQISLSEGEIAKLESVLGSLKSINALEDPPILSDDLRNASLQIADLLGLNPSSDSLNYIFSKMCIGK
jgi:tRNA modification GTPase